MLGDFLVGGGALVDDRSGEESGHDFDPAVDHEALDVGDNLLVCRTPLGELAEFEVTSGAVTSA